MSDVILDKPKVGNLVGNAINFFMANLDAFWACVKPVIWLYLPLLFLTLWLQTDLQVAPEVAENGEAAFPAAQLLISMLAGVPQVFLIGCCVLSWHRMFLRGVDFDDVINPFSFKEGESKAVFAFMGVSYMPVVLMLILGLLVWGVVSIMGNVSPLFFLPLFVVYFYGLIQISRFSFVFPALALGHDVTLMEARELSKGLLWKLILSSFLVGLVMMFPMMFVGFFVGFFSGLLGALPFITAFVISVVNMVVTFAALFLYAGILSQLYRYAVESRGAAG